MAQTRSSNRDAGDGRAVFPPDAANAGSNWLGAALFLGLAGALHETGFYGLIYPFGWLGGCLLADSLIAPHLRRFGRYTLPEFLGARYGNGTPRLIGTAVLLTVLGLFLTAQLYGIGIVVAPYLDVSFEVATFIGLAVALVCVLLSTVWRAPWLAMLAPVVAILAYAATGLALNVHESLPSIVADSEAAAAPTTTFDRAAGFALFVCLIVGIASLPRIGMRRITSESARTTKQADRWDFLLVGSIMAFAVPYSDAATQGIARDVIVLEAPAIAGISPVFTVLIAVGALALLLLAATRLLRAILQLLDGDDPRARDTKANMARASMVAAGTILIGIAAACAAGTRPADILTMMAWGLSLAASGLFTPIVLGLWWKRTTTVGAGCGMVAGFGICLLYIVGTQFFPEQFVAIFGSDPNLPIEVGWWGIDNVAAGLFGIPVALAVTVLVSLVTPAPSVEMQEFVASLRRRRPAAANGAHGRD